MKFRYMVYGWERDSNGEADNSNYSNCDVKIGFNDLDRAIQCADTFVKHCLMEVWDTENEIECY